MVTGFRSAPSRRTDAISSSSAFPILSSSSLVHVVTGASPLRAELSFGTAIEDALSDRYSRECVRPACVECKMRDHFRSLRSREAVIHRPIEVVRNLRDLARGDQ